MQTKTQALANIGAYFLRNYDVEELADGTMRDLIREYEAAPDMPDATLDLLVALEGLLALQDGRYVTEGMKRDAVEKARAAAGKAKGA